MADGTGKIFPLGARPDTAGDAVYLEVTNGVAHVQINQQYAYETVAASQTAQVMGTTGAAGDFLHAVTCTATTSTIAILDGATTIITITPAAVGDTFIFDWTATTAWKITTAAGTSCVVSGSFT